jgi:hypothetical protein
MIAYAAPYSVLTLAAYADSNWYYVDFDFADKIAFGYNRGCDFYENACHSTNVSNYPEFCDGTISGDCTADSTG